MRKKEADKGKSEVTIRKAVPPRCFAKNQGIYIPRIYLKLCKRVSISKSHGGFGVTFLKIASSAWEYLLLRFLVGIKSRRVRSDEFPELNIEKLRDAFTSEVA